METTKGLLHLYIGSGKGKTTAAVGLAARMAGTGKGVLFVQFLKGRPTGELASLAALGVVLRRTGDVKKFIPQMTPAERERCAEQCRECLGLARQALREGEYGLVVLDEALDAANRGMIDPKELLKAVVERHPSTEIVLTGRDPAPELVELADYISEIRCVKHPYEKGISARQGVEY